MIMIDEHAIHLPHGVVPCGTGNRPGLEQLLAGLEDLLHGDPLLRGKRSQPVQISERIAQAVGVVDAQPGHSCLAPTSDEGMGSRKDLGILNSYAGERGDGEESAVVDLAVTARVVDELVVLPVMHGRDILALGPAPWSEWEAVLEVAQLAIHHGQLCIITEDGNYDSAPAPVNVEP